MNDSTKEFNEFLKAEEGCFNGFRFVEEFHREFDKRDAIFTAESDDCAAIELPNGEKLHVGADGIMVYIMGTKLTKWVEFNRSVYVF